MKIRDGDIRYFYVHLSCIGSGRYARVHFAIRDLLIQPFMTGFQGVSIHLDHPAIIRHQAINLTFHIRCLCIDRSRKAPGNQWTKFVN